MEKSGWKTVKRKKVIELVVFACCSSGSSLCIVDCVKHNRA